MNLRKLIACLVLFFTLTACANSAENANSLLWKISGNGLEAPSYLFGTHHLIPLSFLDSIAGLDEAFEATGQTTVGELDMSKMNEMQMKIMGAAIMPNEYNYQTLMSETDFQLLDKTLKELVGTGLDQLGRMKPAMLSNLISITLYQKYYPALSSGTSRSGQTFPSRKIVGNCRRADPNAARFANHRKAGRAARVHGKTSRDAERANG